MSAPSTRSRLPRRPAAETADDQTAGAQRLQKLLAASGVGSRRACELLIAQGRVRVDGQVVTRLGTCVVPGRHKILVDDQPLRKAEARRLYLLVHKPPGVLSTNRDPAGRLRVIDLVDTGERLFTVGRLDKSSSGLILVTNDGQLAQQLAHPRFGVPKTYLVTVAGHPSAETLARLRQGIHLAEGRARFHAVSVRHRRKQSTLLEVVLQEGRNREIRRLLARCGHKVLQLKRIALGPLRLGDLPAGSYRVLSRDEVKGLARSASRSAGRRDAQAPGDHPAGQAAAGRSAAGKAGRRPGGPRKHSRSPHRPVQEAPGPVSGTTPSQRPRRKVPGRRWRGGANTKVRR